MRMCQTEPGDHFLLLILQSKCSLAVTLARSELAAIIHRVTVLRTKARRHTWKQAVLASLSLLARLRPYLGHSEPLLRPAQIEVVRIDSNELGGHRLIVEEGGDRLTFTLLADRGRILLC